MKMVTIVTIKGKPVIDIYESFDGSYWFITERSHEQDSVIDGKVYKDDQILFGYVKLSACPEFAEFGYISERELRLLSPWVWRVPRENWAFCPEVEVKRISEKLPNKTTKSEKAPSPRSLPLYEKSPKEVRKK